MVKPDAGRFGRARRSIVEIHRNLSPAAAFVLLLLAAAGAATEEPRTACPACPPLVQAPNDPLPLYVVSSALDVVCMPARVPFDEDRWTFFLRGPGITKVVKARLFAGGTRSDALRLEFPTPFGLLIDFALPKLAQGTKAELALIGSQGELGRLPIDISGPSMVPVGHRQPEFVRLQLADGTLIYPLHQSGQVKGRTLDEVGGDPEFLTLLRDMGIPLVRKTLSTIAEGDSLLWDERNHRELAYGGDQLRSYLIYLDPERSQEAFREIFRAFPQVEAGWVNEDLETRKRKRYGGN